MEFGEKLLLLFEERWGKRASSAILLLMGTAVAVACISAISSNLYGFWLWISGKEVLKQALLDKIINGVFSIASLVIFLKISTLIITKNHDRFMAKSRQKADLFIDEFRSKGEEIVRDARDEASLIMKEVKDFYDKAKKIYDDAGECLAEARDIIEKEKIKTAKTKKKAVRKKRI